MTFITNIFDVPNHIVVKIRKHWKFYDKLCLGGALHDVYDWSKYKMYYPEDEHHFDYIFAAIEIEEE